MTSPYLANILIPIKDVTTPLQVLRQMVIDFRPEETHKEH